MRFTYIEEYFILKYRRFFYFFYTNLGKITTNFLEFLNTVLYHYFTTRVTHIIEL